MPAQEGKGARFLVGILPGDGEIRGRGQCLRAAPRNDFSRPDDGRPEVEVDIDETDVQHSAPLAWLFEPEPGPLKRDEA